MKDAQESWVSLQGGHFARIIGCLREGAIVPALKGLLILPAVFNSLNCQEGVMLDVPKGFDWKVFTPEDSPKTPMDLSVDLIVQDLSTPNLTVGETAFDFQSVNSWPYPIVRW